jgi:hypothetical protein
METAVMKKITLMVLLASLVVGYGAAAEAHGGWRGGRGGHGHHGGHSSFGFYLGVPLYWPTYPRYYSPPVVIERRPEVYIQQAAPASPPPPQASSYWYYCPDSRTYYPYVTSCASNWMRVIPDSAPQQ